MNKKLISAAAGLTAVMVGISSVSFGIFGTDNVSSTSVVCAAQTDIRDITNQEFIKDMGLGWNLGNTFDCIGSWISPGSPTNYETAWGNPAVVKSVISSIKADGFRTIRIPVSWANNIGNDNKIDSQWMARIKEVADWCMEEDLYVIINLHHDGGADDSSWIRNAQNDYASTEKKYADVWSQICSQFKDYSDHLIFESMNEVEFTGVSKTQAYSLLNSLNQKFVDTVRASGSVNSQRHLLIAGYNTDIAQTCDSRFKMPEDPANKLLLSIHYYTPSPFCVAESDVSWCTPQTTWGTADDYAELESNMQKLYTNFVSKGIPVVIGEYGVLTEQKNNKDPESIRKFLNAVAQTSLEYGMCPVLWDSGSSGDMKYFDRNSVDFNDQKIVDMYAALSDKILKGEIEYKDVVQTSYDEKTVTVPSDGWIDISPYKSKKLVGLRFNISCSTDWDSQGGGGINNLNDWNDCDQFAFNSVYDTVEVKFTKEDTEKMADKIGIWFWWTLLDDPNNENSGHTNELSFKNNQITLLFESDTPAVTTATTVTTTPQPTQTTTVTTTPQPTQTTTVTTTSASDTVTTLETTVQNELVYGDLDMNGAVDMSDMTALSLYLVGDQKFNEIQLKAADVNNDTKVGLSDLAHFKQYIMKDNVVLGPVK